MSFISRSEVIHAHLAKMFKVHLPIKLALYLVQINLFQINTKDFSQEFH